MDAGFLCGTTSVLGKTIKKKSNWYYFKVKGKGHPRKGYEGHKGEWRYSSTLSLISALHWGGCSTPRLGRFTPGNGTRYPLYRRLRGPQGRSRWAGKIAPPPGFDPRRYYIKINIYFRHVGKATAKSGC